MEIQTIVVPTDFGPSASEALRYASDLARRHLATLVLTHVVHLPDVGLPYGDPLGELHAQREELVARAREHLQAHADEHVPGGIRVEVEARAGDPTREILGVAEERAAGLVVVGTHGRRGLAHFLMGSVAERLVRECPCPVLTVRGR